MTLPSVARLSMVAVAAALVAPAPALAQADAPPTAQVELSLGGPAKECDANTGVCGDLGGRAATVKWSSTCSQSLGHETTVTVMERLKKSGAKPVLYIPESGDRPGGGGSGGEGASGSLELVVPAGVHLFARVDVECTTFTNQPDGSQTQKVTSVRADSPEVFLPPHLTKFRFQKNLFCGKDRPLRRYVQAGQSATLDYLLRFSRRSVLPKTDPATFEANIRLYGQGAGLNFNRKLDPKALRRRQTASFETVIRPRRAGTLKIWTTVAGVRTNSLSIKVVKRPCR